MSSSLPRRRHPLAVFTLAVALVLVWLAPSPARAATDPCSTAPVNVIACENSKPGSPASEWDAPQPSDTIVGFTTDISYNVGTTAQFKISTNASAYTIDIYRMGYYGGNGARKIASITPSVKLPQSQPACLSDSSTGLLDCGNWAVSASWAIPADAVSGIYFAHIVRADTGAENQIVFVVRNDASRSDLVFQTSDQTWQAYNTWGGTSLYTGTSNGSSDGRAFKVSYNRPFNTRSSTPNGRDFVFGNEYPMVRWLERNGYDVSYLTGIDSARSGALLKNHKVFLSVGHDEYWSGQQRANVEAARDAGVNLAFFSGNEVFWKTRWESSVDGSATPYRTLVTYKETKANAKIDPSSEWTGTWRDPRFSPPADGGRPENGLTGTIFTVNEGTFAIQVPAADGKMRLWRNTSVASLAAGSVATLADSTLGYEWDEDLDNGARPTGLIDLSTSTYSVPQKLTDYGSNTAAGTATHHLTLYRAPSGALVFGAGTIQWSWGLDSVHDGAGPAEDARMQQATANLLADMGAQPTTLQASLVAPTASTDTAAPTATITSPAAGASLANGSTITVTGTAVDSGGGRVGGVEVSLDGGKTWHPAQGREQWSYTGSVVGAGASTIQARATDDSANTQASPTSVAVTVTCPCSVFPASTVPANPADSDTSALELGMKFTPAVDGWATGVRFYKGTGNGGTHTGSLWSLDGTRLATVTFSNESASGWQSATFPSAVALTAGTTYVVSYYAPQGHYAADAGYFWGVSVNTPPLAAPSSAVNGGNGVYAVGAGFPTSTYKGGNYYVDVQFDNVSPPDSTPPSVTKTAPIANASSVSVSVAPSATFSEPVQSASIGMTVSSASGSSVAGTVGYDATSRTATFQPAAPLAAGASYTVSLQGVKDLSGNVMATYTWTFATASAAPAPGQCPCSIWPETATPSMITANDPAEVELGVKFRASADGTVSGVRFYKGPQNTGTHIGTLWSATGTQLASATFTGESSTGWEQVLFAQPVKVTAGTTYVVSYHTTVGYYSATSGGLNAAVTNGPLTALANGFDGGNGVYRYGTRAFPSSSGGGANYWVDVVWSPLADTTPPAVASTSPAAGESAVKTSAAISVTFTEPVKAGTTSISVAPAGGGAAISGTTTLSADSTTVIFTPSAALPASTTFAASVSGAQDLAGNLLASTYTWSFSTSGPGSCPCTLFSSGDTPAAASVSDPGSVELGVRFTSDVAGWVSGVKFYKGPNNTGTHVGSLWTAGGTLLSSATFTSETSGGWQTVTFPAPVAISANTTYVASYHAPNGGYAASGGYFGQQLDNVPLHALAATAGGNGLYAYGDTQFPTGTYNATNYWVDVVFSSTKPADTVAPAVSAVTPLAGASSVPTSTVVTATFTEAVSPGAQLSVVGPNQASVVGTTALAADGKSVTFTPGSALSYGTGYQVTLTGVSDLAGNPMPTYSWSFTTAQAPAAGCPCSIWPDSAVPANSAYPDSGSVELGVKFRADVNGTVTGVRFYKGSGNTGTHVGSLWTAGGQLLASATFSNETSAGWQSVTFSQPVAITAGTTYVASYFAPNGHYAVDVNGLSSGVDLAPLHALASGLDGPNGVYAYGGTSSFPTGASSNNYWVDVIFTPTAV